ncbi:MAG TPA: cation diffusion facilitator family transporter [Paracoccus sp. (in: a-proteobacteria)]|uniref:cation diffusion facilitator family transporter n=1 Tax=uncultured Paracoccus sp. TaxID=189685 RepID=UPI00260ACDE5|nr:cation diffusion facilitator family transporter [uncultured Paracoccus sp.]HMQ40990.1 cation diffusion facilitator family transporter [Paracoccus sp. (in: a-proteobacteria)]HMR35182.1 cation diffusion facilitator family transporter [Paracoccus sp. (in: a-proteobacteria)]
MAHDHHHDDHDHGHSHHHRLDSDRAILWAVLVNLALTGAQIIGGWWADSVALIADGVHNFSDAMALVLAFGARRLARRGASPGMSFGWQRSEIIAAFVNYTSLVVISVWLGYEAIMRLSDPPAVAGGVVMALAGLAVVIDLATAALVWRSAKDSLNLRAALLHNLTDAGVSVAVIVGGALVWAFGWMRVDPILTILISVVILIHVAADIRPVLRILMLGAPPGTDAGKVKDAMEELPGVIEAHHLHLWQIDEKRSSAEMHLVIAEEVDFTKVIVSAKHVLAERFGIAHATIEVERQDTGCAGMPAH